MAWVRIDDNFSEHPRWASASAHQVQWFVFALCYANRNVTDGFIPFGIAHRLTSDIDGNNAESIVRSLVESGVISQTIVKGIGGYQIRGYLEYQPSKREILKERQNGAERLRRWRKRQCNGVTNGDETAEKRPKNAQPQPQPQSLVQKERTTSVHADARTVPEGFLNFWATYPRKVNKTSAVKAWNQVKPVNGTVEAMTADIARRVASGEWGPDRVQFIPHASTYLRGRRWEDEPETLNLSGQSPRAPSVKAIEDAKGLYRRWGSCQHDPKHDNWRDCIQAIARSL